MKNRPMKKAYIIAIAASLITAPLTFAVESTDNSAYTLASNDGTNSELQIDGVRKSATEVRGNTVINHQNEKLGKVEDLVYNTSSKEITHLIVSTDNWFDGRHAIIPLASVSMKHDADENSTTREVLDWIRGDTVVLKVTEDAFDALATFERGVDLEAYLSSEAGNIADALKMGSEEVYSSDGEYRSAMVNRTAQLDRGYKSLKSNNDKSSYLSTDSFEGWEDKPLEIDGQYLNASELRGVEVVNYEDERLGRVVDIVVNKSSDEAEYLAIRTDNWFDGAHAIVPLKSIRYHPYTKEPHMKDGANWWDGDHIVLDMTDDRFDEIADYKRSDDFNAYIKENRDRINANHELTSTDLPTLSSSYTFIYSVPMQNSATAYEDPKHTNESGENMTHDQTMDKDSMATADKVQLGGKSTTASSLKGTTVTSAYGEQIATVSDVVIDAKTREAEFLVLSNDASDSSEMKVVPVSAVSYEKNHVSDKGNQSFATWDGEKISLNTNQSNFTSMTSFSSDSNFEEYLSENSREISDTFNIDHEKFNKKDKEYIFLFKSNRIKTAAR